MTLRTIESEFSEQLQKDLMEENTFNLTLEGALFTKTHPKIIWARLQFQNNPEQDPIALVIPGWSYDCYSQLSEAVKVYPQIKMQFEGRPWSVFKFLEGEFNEAIIDFGPIGAVVLFKQDLSPKIEKKLHWHTLPLCLSYALSPELWGPQGKWTRFHSRLHDLFNSAKLLKNGDVPGYYLLNEEARKLEAHGFQGTNLEKSYLLVLPWTFSLTALKKLENCIRQEF